MLTSAAQPRRINAPGERISHRPPIYTTVLKTVVFLWVSKVFLGSKVGRAEIMNFYAVSNFCDIIILYLVVIMKKDVFLSAAHNIEIENAKKQIGLLRQYMNATDDVSKADIESKFSQELKIMITKKSSDELISRLTTAIEKDEFRPRDMSVYVFALSPDLDYVGGEFSTFDAKLSQMIKRGAPSKEIKTYMTDQTYNRRNVATQYVSDFMQILDTEPELQESAIKLGRTGSAREYGEIMEKIAHKLRDKMGVSATLSVDVVDSWDAVRQYLPPTDNDKYTLARHCQMQTNTGKTFHAIFLNRAMIYERTVKEQTDKALFREMIANLAHEFGHFIDEAAPNKGALGAQKSVAGLSLYEKMNPKRENEYHINPTEASSDVIESMMRRAMQEKSND